MKNFRLLLFLVTLLVVLVLSIFAFTLINQNEFANEIEPLPFCGTVTPYIPGPNGANQYITGKNLFKENCGTCHSKNMVSDATGPALGDAISRWQNDTLEIWNYLKDPNQYIELSKDPWVQSLHAHYDWIVKPEFKNLTLEETKAIVDYIEFVH